MDELTRLLKISDEILRRTKGQGIVVDNLLHELALLVEDLVVRARVFTVTDPMAQLVKGDVVTMQQIDGTTRVGIMITDTKISISSPSLHYEVDTLPGDMRVIRLGNKETGL